MEPPKSHTELGRQLTSFKEVKDATPSSSDEATSFQHSNLFDLLQGAMKEIGLESLDEGHVLAQDGDQYMGFILTEAFPETFSESPFTPVVGFRNVYDSPQFGPDMFVASTNPAGTFFREADGLFFSSPKRTLSFNQESISNRESISQDQLLEAVKQALIELRLNSLRQQLRLSYYHRNEMSLEEALEYGRQAWEQNLVHEDTLERIEWLWNASSTSSTTWSLLCVLRGGPGENELMSQLDRHPLLAELLDQAAGYHEDLTEKMVKSTRMFWSSN